jgi:hypothetical protein
MMGERLLMQDCLFYEFRLESASDPEYRTALLELVLWWRMKLTGLRQSR